MALITCARCGEGFQGQASRGRRYCSQRCRNPRDGQGCRGCGAELERNDRGLPREWCSPACYQRHFRANQDPEARRIRLENKNRRQKKRKSALRAQNPLRCRHCDVIIPQGKYCLARECKSAQRREQLRNRPPAFCNVQDCEGQRLSRGMCARHYRAWWRQNRPDVDAAKNARYRALKAAATVENVVPRLVYERDGWCCHLCDKKIDPKLKWPDLMSASVDHVIPLSKGGAHSYENCRAAHHVCNARKGARGGGQLQLAV